MDNNFKGKFKLLILAKCRKRRTGVRKVKEMDKKKIFKHVLFVLISLITDLTNH